LLSLALPPIEIDKIEKFGLLPIRRDKSTTIPNQSYVGLEVQQDFCAAR
jgi:hypothetical protein